jgi:hypothetical protein
MSSEDSQDESLSGQKGKEVVEGPPAEVPGAGGAAELSEVVVEEKEAPGLKNSKWEAMISCNEDCFLAIGKKYPLNVLLWDTKLCEGQSRTVSESHVAKLRASLRLHPPQSHLRCLAWDNGSMQCTRRGHTLKY